MIIRSVLVAAILTGSCNAFLTPQTLKTHHNLLRLANEDGEQTTTTTTTTADNKEETFQRSLLEAQLSNALKQSSSSTSDDEKESNARLLESLKIPIPPASHTVETKQTKLGPVHTLTVHLGQPGHPEPLVFETGRIGRQAAGAILLTRGESIVYSTCGTYITYLILCVHMMCSYLSSPVCYSRLIYIQIPILIPYIISIRQLVIMNQRVKLTLHHSLLNIKNDFHRLV